MRHLVLKHSQIPKRSLDNISSSNLEHLSLETMDCFHKSFELGCITDLISRQLEFKKIRLSSNELKFETLRELT
jgi:hypothetical protein